MPVNAGCLYILDNIFHTHLKILMSNMQSWHPQTGWEAMRQRLATGVQYHSYCELTAPRSFIHKLLSIVISTST